ncbi:hypothetical protein [uncultured Thiodictyon sp.]|uniref:hypothetical protein n=1 Tax=uncultured Thiodictyon sp. TaxID=1846217 RepID=UPI0025FBD5C5|nr:hypothetical protein [uncultured Thiodictyon sp.]
MRLTTLFIAATTLLVAGLLTLAPPADARRMGGGGNIGKQYSMPRQTAAPQGTPGQGAQGAAGQRAPQAGGASRWLGPLAGLAAGGLLASVFFGGAFQGLQIEVVRLNAELASVQRDGDLAVASILFSGLIREDRQGVAQELREYWHVQHAWASPSGDWYVAGIQQA